MSSERAIDHALRLHESRLMAIPGVQGVAEGETATGDAAIIVYVDKDAHLDSIPAALEGVPARAHVDDPFTAQ